MTDLDAFDDVVARLRDGYSPASFRPGAAAPARRRAPAAIVGTATALTVGAFAVTSVTGLPGSDPDYAWSATPSDLAAGERDAVDRLCRDEFTREFTPTLPVEDAAGNQLPDPGPSGHVGDLLVSESRGDYALSIYSGDEQGAPNTLACLTRTGVDGGWGILALWGGPASDDGRRSPVEVLGASTGALDDFAAAFGTVDGTVADVTIAAPGGAVDATVASGYFLAFWPESGRAPVSATATDNRGDVVWSGEVVPAFAEATEPTE